MSRDLNFSVKSKGVLNDTGSHVYFKSGIISEMVLERDTVTTVHKQQAMAYYLIPAFVMTLGVRQVLLLIASFFKRDISYLQDFYTDMCTAWSLCHSRASCSPPQSPM